VKTATLTTIILMAMSAVMFGCEKRGQQAFQRPPASVTVATAVQQDAPVYIDSVGKTVAREVVSVKPQVSGQITKIHFVDGAELKKGDMLFTIDPRPYRAQLESAEGSLAEKKAALALARIELKRYADLLESKSVSQQDYDQRKNTFEAAQAQVQQSQAAVDTAKINLDYCFIRSPIDGRAGQRLVDVGNVVTFFGNLSGNPSSGQQNVGGGLSGNGSTLLVIQRLDPIYADFTITENDLTTVQRKMKSGPLKADVSLPDDSDKPREGEVSFLDNAVQEGTGTVKLRATIPNNDHYFWPGRFVRVRLVLDTIRGAVLIPAAAPQMSAKGMFVYVIKDDSTAESRPVTLGQRQGDLVVVDQGLKADEKVVVTGQLAVIPNAKVQINNPGALAAKNGGGS
jgi:membrane fusion protein, multidrug efflux system